MLRFIEDPGHGWLEVPETALAKVGLSVADFSLYSYRHNGKLYLEEDCDAPKFFEAWEPKFGKLEYKRVYQTRTRIRGYDRIRIR